ncbi:hypothetical protein [Gellertiella hungarica]|uniref:Uncharacterized protein n=1 Tax=Gellertiella hungarica TaxID=1572859 RepID=A0A7W6NKN1_9HYPH|nr:hypothetical protein [Gellertiella hungarica]MBB4065615.1 hypothetical protein [Gellertiella hungarica]
MTTQHSGKAPISPIDVVMMQGVLIDWCIRHGVSLDSLECEEQARRIVSWFECGCCSESLLRDVFLPPPFFQRH